MKKQRQPIRILHIVTVMNRGGLETMLMNYYRSIDRSKVQFDFLVHHPDKGAYDDEIKTLGGKLYHHMPIGLSNLPLYRKKLKKFFEDHPEYTIVHSHIDALSALPLSAAKAADVPVRIAHSHNSNFDKDSKYLIRQIAKRFIKYYATDFFGCSQNAIASMFGKKIQNPKVIPNAISIKDFSYNIQKRDKIRNELNLKNKFVVGHVGRFDPQKNHEFLVDVFGEIYKKNEDARLILIGDGDGRNALSQKIDAMNLNNVVQFLGIRSDVADLMQGMDVFVMPSRYEGLPVVSIEAQMAGLECFFSSVITKDLAITKNAFFISLAESSHEWARVILEEKEKKINRSQPLGDQDNSTYDISQASKKLEAMYERFVRV